MLHGNQPPPIAFDRLQGDRISIFYGENRGELNMLWFDVLVQGYQRADNAKHLGLR